MQRYAYNTLEDMMLAQTQDFMPPTQNSRVMAVTLGKINMILTKPKVTVAENVLDKAILDHLILHLLSAPESLLPSA